jgi:steroid delta-isomerase-like uncharacterized protein
MGTDQNKATARRLVDEGFNKQNLKLLDEIFSADSITHDTQRPNLPKGPEGAKLSMMPYFTAFPDARVTIEKDIAEGDYVVHYVRVVGTHTAELNGIPATGKRTNTTGVEILRFNNGKVVETWGVWDQLGLMQQLGVIPTPETAKQPALAGVR